jgi:hypothetical protein
MLVVRPRQELYEECRAVRGVEHENRR